jgi:hypothetical protein
MSNEGWFREDLVKEFYPQMRRDWETWRAATANVTIAEWRGELENWKKLEATTGWVVEDELRAGIDTWSDRQWLWVAFTAARHIAAQERGEEAAPAAIS